MKRSLENNHKTTPRKQVRFEEEDDSSSSSSSGDERNNNNDDGAFEVCIMLDHIALKCPLLRPTLKAVVGRHAIPHRAYTKYAKRLADDWRAESAMIEQASGLCIVASESVWDTPEECPEWASELEHISFYCDDDGVEDYQDELDASLAARILIARLRTERLHAVRRREPKTRAVFDDAIASLLPVSLADLDAENRKHRACHTIEMVRQRCPLLAPCLDPIIARHSTPRDAYERIKAEPSDDAESQVDEFCQACPSLFWATPELRPAWAKDITAVKIDDPQQPLTLPIAAFVVLLQVEAVLQDDGAAKAFYRKDKLCALERAFYGEVFDVLDAASEKRDW
ncbi:hypothetical protein [Medusavirus stheno T3]|uniref:Uncharacterized protein n=1 Tax=Medusavirus stheno T3 TaxID=3069717 RepID=A0A7S7YG53_9VIRU|nr:hypothetical protein QKU73_gp185 [Acanthamoeba castellanii medusavirus]QPB44590.1 hypothetical protein [Medusavirus stheno T3]